MLHPAILVGADVTCKGILGVRVEVTIPQSAAQNENLIYLLRGVKSAIENAFILQKIEYV